MIMLAAEIFVTGLGLYLLAGAVFALWFVSFGVGKLDPVARGAPIQFRILIFPASATLWPILIAKLLGSRA